MCGLSHRAASISPISTLVLCSGMLPSCLKVANFGKNVTCSKLEDPKHADGHSKSTGICYRVI